jgi:hypothetical protein
MNNQNHPISVPIYLGSLTDNNKLIPAMYLPKRSKIVSAHVINGAAIAASDADYCQIELKNGANIVAEIDTRAAHENALAQNVAKALNVSESYDEPAAGSSLSVLYKENGNVALTDAVLVVTYYPF